MIRKSYFKAIFITKKLFEKIILISSDIRVPVSHHFFKVWINGSFSFHDPLESKERHVIYYC